MKNTMEGIKEFLFAGERNRFIFLECVNVGEDEYNKYVINIESIKNINYDDRMGLICISCNDSLLSPPIMGKVTDEEYKLIIDALCGDLTDVIIQNNTRYVTLGASNDTDKTEH